MVQQLELVKQKLSSIPTKDIKELAGIFGLPNRGRHGEIAARLISRDATQIDAFIKRKYQEKVVARQVGLISDAELIAELEKVESIEWGIIQGQLDRKIQSEYVRRYVRFNDFVNSVKNQLRDEVTGYAIATWYNHWSTVLIEDQISQHPNVVPTLKNIKGIDLFFNSYPFDLKITYLPRDYDLNNAINQPQNLARWLYENQGSQRFGAENRLYVVVGDTADITQSWKIKRDIALVSLRIDDFLNAATVNENDIISFFYNGRSYITTCKILLITK